MVFLDLGKEAARSDAGDVLLRHLLDPAKISSQALWLLATILT